MLVVYLFCNAAFLAYIGNYGSAGSLPHEVQIEQNLELSFVCVCIQNCVYMCDCMFVCECKHACLNFAIFGHLCGLLLVELNW